MLEREGRSGTAIKQKSFDAPDEVRRFPKGIVTLVRVGSVTIGRGTLEPGFRWSTSLRPIQGTPSCQIHHLQLLLQGRFHVEMDDGETAEIGPGDVFDVPPGHDVWVVGDEPVVVVDVLGNIGALGAPGEHERLVTTLLMSDIVDSTLTATRLGDAVWKQVLVKHNRLIRAQFDRFRGREVNTTGDGFLATFGSAAGALRAAVAMRDGIRGLGIELRIGVLPARSRCFRTTSVESPSMRPRGSWPWDAHPRSSCRRSRAAWWREAASASRNAGVTR
jgi:hypothetical protein